MGRTAWVLALIAWVPACIDLDPPASLVATGAGLPKSDAAAGDAPLVPEAAPGGEVDAPTETDRPPVPDAPFDEESLEAPGSLEPDADTPDLVSEESPSDGLADLALDRSEDLSPDIATDPMNGTDLSIGLVGHWRLDEGSGTVANDSSGGGHHGILVGGPTWVPGFPAAAFPNPAALSFDKSDDHVVVPHAAAHTFTASQSYTLAVWARTPSLLTGDWRGIVTKSRDRRPWYGVWLAPDNTLSCNVSSDTGAGSIRAKSPPAPSTWYHVVCVQDGAANRRSMYVNGDLQGTATAGLANGSGDLWIGGAKGISEFWGGLIDDVRLHARALSAEEITALAAGR